MRFGRPTVSGAVSFANSRGRPIRSHNRGISKVRKAMESINHQYVLAHHPEGALQESNFTWQEAPLPKPGAGEVLVRVLYLSLDPANRGWINKGGS